MNMLKLLKLPHIRLLWGSQVLSTWGDQLFLLAIVWIAVQQVGSGAGIVIATGSISSLLVGVFAGAFVDRWNPRLTMIVVDTIRALTVLTLPVLALVVGLQIWHLIVVNVIVETLDMLFDPALQVSLPILINDTHLLHATNGLMDSSRRLARIFGPGLAGIMLLFIPIIHFFTIDALSFFASAFAVYLLGNRFAWKPAQRVAGVRRVHSFFTEIFGTFQLIDKHQSMTWAFIAVGTGNLAWGASFIVGVPLLASHTLGATAGVYGLIVGVFGFGNVLSSLWVGSLNIRHPMRFIFIGSMVLGIGYCIIALAGNIEIAMLGAAIAAAGGPMGALPLLTIIQTQFPSEYIGKISSLRLTIASLGLTLGVLLAAPMYLFLNIRLALAIFPVLQVAVGIISLVRLTFLRKSPIVDMT